MLSEIHKGICRNYSGGKTLAQKTLRQGYYWPTMNKDAINFVKKCDQCQQIVNIARKPLEKLLSLYGS